MAEGRVDDRRRRRRLRPGSASRRARASRSTGVPWRPTTHAYVLLHKPTDVVTTVRDTHGRRTVIDLVGADRRLFPVGRLDAETTGLLLLTNDGELAARLMHPRHGVEKTYEATVRGAVTAATRGAAGGGHRAGRASARRRRACASCTPPGRQSVVEIVLHEGRKRQVRRMCEAVGHPVISLHRSAYAGLRLGALKAGASRPLRAAEVELLRAAAGGGLTWRRRASTATSRWPGSAPAAASRGSCAPGAWRSTASSHSSRRPGVEPGASVTLDGAPVVADGPAGVLVALGRGRGARDRASERAAPRGHLAGRPPGGADQRRAAGAAPARARLRPEPPGRDAAGGGASARSTPASSTRPAGSPAAAQRANARARDGGPEPPRDVD